MKIGGKSNSGWRKKITYFQLKKKLQKNVSRRKGVKNEW